MLSSKILSPLSFRILVASSAIACWCAQVFAQDEGTVFESNEAGLEFSIQVPPFGQWKKTSLDTLRCSSLQPRHHELSCPRE